jgi:hypothetical protein
MSQSHCNKQCRFTYSTEIVFLISITLIAVFAGSLLADAAAPWAAALATAQAQEIKIGNYLVNAPYGIAFIIDDETGFVIDPVWDRPKGSRYGDSDPSLVPPGVAAPDFSFFRAQFPRGQAQVKLTWGRVGAGAVAAMLETDRPVELSLRLPIDIWPHFHAAYTAAPDGLAGQAIKPRGGFVPFVLRASPAPAFVRANIAPDAEVVLSLTPDTPTCFVAGVGELPPLASVQPTLTAAERRYSTTRVAADGDWGDFLAGMMDTLNNLRLYASDNRRIVHVIGRGWWMGTNPDLSPYFVWDPSFSGVMASLEDPAGARETVRTILSYQTPDGRVPSFSHWMAQGNETYVTLYRSFPPVTSMCVWKMHERRPDTKFLAEVYQALVQWHDWWPKARDGNHNGLLEWGSEQHSFDGAQLETGWDDNLEYVGAALNDTTMNADAVDLNSLWSMDAEYLAKIATALGKTEDARRIASERESMNRRINERLWNEPLGTYCSRLWEVPAVEGAALAPEVLFKNGLDAIFYGDLARTSVTLRRHDGKIDFDWRQQPLDQAKSTDRWSAHWMGEIGVPESGRYRLRINRGNDVRATLDSRPMERWIYEENGARYVDLDLEAGRSHPFVLDYFNLGKGTVLRVTAHRLSPGREGSDWLTRLTPMNFYPLFCGAPDRARADRVLSILYDPDQFWLSYLVPTVSKKDPMWEQQNYWRGQVWPPCNYLLWLGLLRYADGAHQAEFARRSVQLFMRNWSDKRESGENYKSTDGTVGGMPHYSWGPLLCEIAAEALAGTGPDFRPVPRQDGAITEHIVLRHIPFGGKLYRIEARGGKVTVSPE